MKTDPNISKKKATDTLCNDIFYDEDDGFEGASVGTGIDTGEERGSAEGTNRGTDVAALDGEALDIGVGLSTLESCDTGLSVSCTIQLV